jgi:hypothetical protein
MYSSANPGFRRLRKSSKICVKAKLFPEMFLFRGNHPFAIVLEVGRALEQFWTWRCKKNAEMSCLEGCIYSINGSNNPFICKPNPFLCCLCCVYVYLEKIMDVCMV